MKNILNYNPPEEPLYKINFMKNNSSQVALQAFNQKTNNNSFYKSDNI